MLKGHVFKEQKFGNQIFALFINTFLNGKNGIQNNYKNSMAVTYSGSNVTVDSGVVCIKGRFLEEDTSTTVDAGTDSLYCKFIVEIDLSKVNTTAELNQAYYKIISDSSAYPELTQDDIITNNTGVYQYELARFKTGINGITDFQDMRTYLDFESIYAEIERHIQEIDDGSIYVLKETLKYSTTEKVVGEWIDGKPLYQKTLVGTKVSGIDLNLNIAENIDCAFVFDGFLKISSIGSYDLNRYENENEWTRTEINPSTGILKFKSGTGLYSNGPVYITVRYTKTTD